MRLRGWENPKSDDWRKSFSVFSVGLQSSDYTAKVGPIGSEHITPAREKTDSLEEYKDENHTYLHRKMKCQILFWKYASIHIVS
jgi:hypothetical protein